MLDIPLGYCYNPYGVLLLKNPNMSIYDKVNQTLSRSEILEHIYRIATEPDKYDQFMDALSMLALEAIENLGDVESSEEVNALLKLDPELERHFDQCFEILERIGRPPIATEVLVDDLSVSLDAVFCINKKAIVTKSSRLAVEKFDASVGSHLRVLRINSDGKNALEKLLPDIHKMKPGHLAAVISSNLSDQEIQSISDFEHNEFQTVEVLHDANGASELIVRLINFRWSSEIADALVLGFNLSQVEIEIIRDLASGSSLNQISVDRNRSLHTVRTQYKTAQRKIGVNSQNDIIRLLHGLGPSVTSQIQFAKQLYRPGKSFVHSLSCGRQIPVHVYGPDCGNPVLFVHGMLDGISLPDSARDVFERQNIRLICPTRPNFNLASPRDGYRDAPESFCDDMRQLLDSMKLHRVCLVGHMAGSVYTSCMAALMPERITGVVQVSGGVPIRSRKQISEMSERQQVIAYLARYTPRLLPLAVRAGISLLDAGGHRKFAEALFKESPADLAVINDPEKFSIVVDGYNFATRSGVKAFQVDSYHVTRDWTEYSVLMEENNIPVRQVHGNGDRVVVINSVREHASRYSNVELIELGDQGQLLLYTNDGQMQVFKELNKLIEMDQENSVIGTSTVSK